MHLRKGHMHVSSAASIETRTTINSLPAILYMVSKSFYLYILTIVLSKSIIGIKLVNVLEVRSKELKY